MRKILKAFQWFLAFALLMPSWANAYQVIIQNLFAVKMDASHHLLISHLPRQTEASDNAPSELLVFYQLLTKGDLTIYPGETSQQMIILFPDHPSTRHAGVSITFHEYSSPVPDFHISEFVQQLQKNSPADHPLNNHDLPLTTPLNAMTPDVLIQIAILASGAQEDRIYSVPLELRISRPVAINDNLQVALHKTIDE